MSQITRTVARGFSFTAPRLAIRISHALTRAAAHRYEEQRAQVERTGCGGML